MRQSFTPILTLLDEGLRLYRREFSRFLLLTALVALPMGLAAAAAFHAADWLQSGLGLFVALLATIGGIPLSLYVMGALSRAATLAVTGQPVRLRHALAMHPLRVLGMGCYGSLFLLVVSVMVSIVSMACLCMAYGFIAVGIFVFTASFARAGQLGEAVTGLMLSVGLVAFLVVYVGSMVINGAVYGSAIYAVQPFVQEERDFGATMERSFDLVGFKLGSNLLTFLSASLVFGAAALAATLAIGLLLPLPALFLLGATSPIAQAITATAWVVGVALAMPLLPIWMALLYRQRCAARDGADLAEQIAALTADKPSP